MKRIAITALAALLLVGCGEASSGYDYVAEPRRVPKPKTCSDYANRQEIFADERAASSRSPTSYGSIWMATGATARSAA